MPQLTPQQLMALYQMMGSSGGLGMGGTGGMATGGTPAPWMQGNQWVQGPATNNPMGMSPQMMQLLQLRMAQQGNAMGLNGGQANYNPYGMLAGMTPQQMAYLRMLFPGGGQAPGQVP